MALSNLRPKITVRQEFEDETPLVPPTTLPALLIALHRQMVYRGDAGDFVGGQPGQLYEFPELIGGSIVEQPGTVLDVPEFPNALAPHVYVSNEHGVGEVESGDLTYDFVSDPPTFAISPGASVTFTIVEGDDGDYSAVTGYFTDAEEDFIEAQVAATDVIETLHSDGDYYPSFDVADIISDSQLDVTRRNKAITPALPTCALSAEDGFGFRTLTDTNQQFMQNGLDVNDLLTVDGWDILISVLGGDYGAVGSGTGAPATSRLFSDATKDFSAAGVTAGDVIFSADALGDWVPFFYVTGGIGTTQITDVENIVTTPTPVPALTASAVGVPYDVIDYSTLRDLTGGAVTSSTTGEYGAQGATLGIHTPSQPTYRIYRDASANYTAGTVAAGDEIVIDNLAGAPPYLGPGNWPVFVVQTVLDATNLEVSQHDSNVPLSTASVLTPSFVSYEIRLPTLVTSNHPGAYLAEGTGAGGPTERRMTAAGKDFATAGVAPGDWIRDVVTGTTLFTVVTVHPAGLGTLDVVNVIPGNPPASATNSKFAFEVTDQNGATLRVVKVLSDTQATVRNVVTGTPGTGTHTGLFLTNATFPDTGQDIVYRIKKTLTGSGLSGDVLCTYAARRTDKANQVVPIDPANYETILGPAVPGNDAGMAAQLLFSILSGTAYFIQVPSDTLTAWTDALQLAETDVAYMPLVMTQREDILALLRDHVDAMSEPEEARERISYQCHKEVVQTTRASEGLGDALTYNKTAAGVTTIVSTTRDLTSYGVIVGDEITCVLNDGSADYQQTNVRIISIQGSTPAAGQSTMRIVADIAVPAPSSGTVADWIIKSKTLSLLERAQNQATYARGIADRRLRNVWPDTARFRFTDETAGENAVVGVFGGGDQLATLGGHFLTVIEAAKRSAENPKQPLTGLVRGSVYQLIDPMGDNIRYQDIIIDGGNYYLVQDGLDQGVYAIRAISTDVTTLERADDNMAPQFDSFARKLRSQLKPLLGPFVLDENYFELISNNFEAVRLRAVQVDKEIKDINLLSIGEDPDRPDKWVVKCRATPYYGANEGEIIIFI